MSIAFNVCFNDIKGSVYVSAEAGGHSFSYTVDSCYYDDIMILRYIAYYELFFQCLWYYWDVQFQLDIS